MCDSSFRAMSGPPSGTSSSTAQSGEEGLVTGDDAGDRLRLGSRVPLVELERAAEDDAVRAREHVAGTAGEGVADLGLRLEDYELAAGGMQLLVVEQVAAAEAGAIEDQRFGQRGDVRRRRELAHLDLAASDLHVADHLAQVAAGLHVHRVVAKRTRPRERMLGGRE